MMLHPMLGFTLRSLGFPASVQSSACRRSSPVTGVSPPYLLGRESSN